MSRNEILQRLNLCIRQPVKEDAFLKLNVARKNISKLLTHKVPFYSIFYCLLKIIFQGDEKFIAEWESFFQGLPRTSQHAHASYEESLVTLAALYGGKIQKKELHFSCLKGYD